MAKSKVKDKSKSKGGSKKKEKNKDSKKGKGKSSKKDKPIEEVIVPLTNLEVFNMLVADGGPIKRDPNRLSLLSETRTHYDIKRPCQSLPNLLPSYVYDLDDLCKPFFNGVPAFRADDLPDKPHISLWEYLTKEDLRNLVDIRENKDESIIYLARKLPEEPKGKASLLLLELLYETLTFAKQSKMSLKKTAAILSIIYHTHKYFSSSLWRTAEETYNYVKEAFLLHTIMRPPKGTEIFEPEECRSALIHFCKMYLRHLPLVQLKMLPNHRLFLEWEPEPEPPLPIQEKAGVEDKNNKKEKKGKKDKASEKGSKTKKGGKKNKK